MWPDICMYWPSCSHYAAHAIVKRGLVIGIIMGSWRILRCNPFSKGGYDPPPGYEEELARQEAGMAGGGNGEKHASRNVGA